MKENWRRRDKIEEYNELEDLDLETDEISEETELEDNERIEIGDLLAGDEEGICGLCAHNPCLYLLLKVEMKLEILRSKKIDPSQTLDSAEFPQISKPDKNQGKPDYSSLVIENAQGLPTMFSEHEGSLGGVAKGWGSGPPTPPPRP